MNLNPTNIIKSAEETEEKTPNVLEELKNGNFIQIFRDKKDISLGTSDG